MNHTRRSRLARQSLMVGAAALAATMTLAACGSGADDAVAGEDGPIKISVLRSTGTAFEPLYIAQDQGYFEEEGLDVSVEAGAVDTSSNIPRVVKGEVQIAMSDGAGIVKAVVGGLPIQMISAVQSAEADPDPVTDGLLVPADSDIKSMTDLEGKTIGTSLLGGIAQVALQSAVKDAGGDPAKVKFVALPLTSLEDAATSGKVDGFISFASFYQASLTKGLRAIGIGTSAVPGAPQASFYSSDSWLEDNPETAEKFLSAMQKAMDYANENHDDVRAIDTEYTEQTPESIANRTIQPFSTQVSVSAMTKLSSVMNEVGLTKSAPTADDLIWADAPKTND